jgi:hypothetical protein
LRNATSEKRKSFINFEHKIGDTKGVHKMTIDYDMIYRNRPICEDQYFLSTITNLVLETIPGFIRPRILVQVKMDELPEYANDTFSAIIEETWDNDYRYRRFLQSFRLSDHKLPNAVGRQGYVFYQNIFIEKLNYCLLDFGTPSYFQKKRINISKFNAMKLLLDGMM